MGKDDNTEGRSIPVTNLTNYTNIIKKTVENSDGKNNENIEQIPRFNINTIAKLSHCRIVTLSNYRINNSPRIHNPLAFPHTP